MKQVPGIFLKLSVAVNLFLLLYLLLAAGGKFPGAKPVESTKAPLISHEPTEEELPSMSVEPAPVEFHWSQFESEDYHAYIENLRGISCPEPIIRAIVTAEIAEHYRPRMSEARRQLASLFWENTVITKTRRKLDPALQQIHDQAREQLSTTSDEMKKVLAELFGPENPTPWLNSFDEEFHRNRLAFLPEELQSLLLEQEKALVQSRHEFRSQRLPEEEVKARIIELEAAQARELQDILGPEELEEFQLRKSPVAWFARPGYGFEPTEEERRAMIRLRESFAPDAKPLEVETALGDLLNPERFAAYQRSKDSDFIAFSKLASRLELPAETATAGYAAKQAAQQTAAQIRSHPLMPPDLQAAALLEIQHETENHLQHLLSPEAFQAYRDQNSRWLEQLGIVDSSQP
jgi:hypothetical protein